MADPGHDTDILERHAQILGVRVGRFRFVDAGPMKETIPLADERFLSWSRDVGQRPSGPDMCCHGDERAVLRRFIAVRERHRVTAQVRPCREQPAVTKVGLCQGYHRDPR